MATWHCSAEIEFQSVCFSTEMFYISKNSLLQMILLCVSFTYSIIKSMLQSIWISSYSLCRIEVFDILFNQERN